MSFVPFRKMHGLGNDFVIVDRRAGLRAPSEAAVRLIADRHRGVGCDQLIVLEASAEHDLFMRIHNPDASEAQACGNATRCVAACLMAESGRDHAVIDSAAGPLVCSRAGDAIAVQMPAPKLHWRDLPLAEPRDTLHLAIAAGPLSDPVAVSMGNPHAVFFVDDVNTVDLQTLGPGLEHHPLFPERANIGIASVLDRQHLRVRVFERGAGLTLACGSGACAAFVAAHRRGLVDDQADLQLDGGPLQIAWPGAGPVTMTGPYAHVFDGRLDPALWSLA